MRTRVSSKGQIVLPAELRREDRIRAGQQFDVERVRRGEYRLVRRPTLPNERLVDLLLQCPEKGFFVPIESESTDKLVATRNRIDFEKAGVKVVDPFAAR